jgi:hypothetical protein
MQDHERQVAKGSDIETDWETYYALKTLSTADPEEFQATDLRRFRSKLNDAEFKQLVDRQTAGTPDAPDLEAMSEDKQIALAVADVKLDDKDGAGLFERAVRAEIGAEQKRIGRRLTADERQRVIDRQMIDGEIERPGAIIDPDRKRYQTHGTPDAQYFVPEGYDEIPAAEVEKITQALDRAGRPVTPAAIADLWARKNR